MLEFDELAICCTVNWNLLKLSVFDKRKDNRKTAALLSHAYTSEHNGESEHSRARAAGPRVLHML